MLRAIQCPLNNLDWKQWSLQDSLTGSSDCNAFQCSLK